MNASKITQNFIIFISGVLLSAIASEWLENMVKVSHILAITTVILVLASVFYYSQTRRRIEALCDEIVSTVQYIEEPFREDMAYKCILFEELIELINKAEKEILILGATVHSDKKYISSDHENRKKYHQAVEKKIKENLENDFIHIRINQFPKKYLNDSPKTYLGDTTLGHIKRVLTMERDCKNLRATIGIMNIPLQRLASIWFIDMKYIAIEVTGITENGTPYFAGLIKITDKGGIIINNFKKLFNELQRKGNPLTLQNLS